MVIEQRNEIENLLNKNFNFTYIGDALKVDRITISKEIIRNRFLKSYMYLPHNKLGIARAVNACERLSNPPYVCSGCKSKNS